MMSQAGSWAGRMTGRRLQVLAWLCLRKEACNSESSVSGKPVIILFPEKEDKKRKQRLWPKPLDSDYSLQQQQHT